MYINMLRNCRLCCRWRTLGVEDGSPAHTLRAGRAAGMLSRNPPPHSALEAKPDVALDCK